MTEIELLLTFPVGSRVRRIGGWASVRDNIGVVRKISSGYVICDFPDGRTLYYTQRELVPCIESVPPITDSE